MRVLALSSQVVHGAVGLSITVPVLQAHGVEVLALPTVLLSSHAGLPQVAGHRTRVDDLDRLLAALDAAGALSRLDGIVTGYLPTAEHVAFAIGAVRAVKATNPRSLCVVDPILGDVPKGLYIDPGAAAAMRDDLVPLADILRPNAFELGWLTGRQVTTLTEARDAALGLAPTVVVSSLEDRHGALATACLSDRETTVAHVARRSYAPHGTGDLLTALMTAAALAGKSLDTALAPALSTVDTAIVQAGPRSSLDVSWLVRHLAARS
jgi:pyridoxine kinase